VQKNADEPEGPARRRIDRASSFFACRATSAWRAATPACARVHDAVRRVLRRRHVVGSAWIVRTRRVVPPHVEQALRTVETFYPTELRARMPRIEASPAHLG
jgi:hypothetical protein